MLNDFEANGYGVTAVSDENLVVLNDVPEKPKACPSLPVLREHWTAWLPCSRAQIGSLAYVVKQC